MSSLHRNNELIKSIIKSLNSLPENNLQEIAKNVDRYVWINKQSESKVKNWYSKRVDVYGNDLNNWEYLTKKVLSQSKDFTSNANTLSSTNMCLSNPVFDKVWRSRFGNTNPFKSGYPKNMSEIYISDYIMFNPNCNISLDNVDRILPYVKFKKINDNSWQFDRWIYEEKGFFSDGDVKPNYDIVWVEKDNTAEMDWIKTEEEKRLAVRAFLTIINETPDKYVNFNSYQVIGWWYNKNDSWLVSWIPNTYNSDKLNTKDNIKLNPQDLIVQLDSKLDKNELIEMLYRFAINGGDDLIKTGIKFNEHGCSNPYDFINKYIIPELESNKKSGGVDNVDNIERILDAEINTKLDLNQLDLTEYVKVNGKYKTKQLIEHINEIIAHRYNCNQIIKPDGKKITKYDLLERMYNLSLPFGLGILNSLFSGNKLLTIKEAIEVLTKSDYVDYLHGTPIKMNFNNFPIVNFNKFEKYNGKDKFNQIIYSLQNNLIVEKQIPSDKYIESEIIRINS